MQNSSKVSGQSNPSKPPNEGKSSEPTIIAEQHRKPEAGPKSIPSDKSAVADAKAHSDKKSSP